MAIAMARKQRARATSSRTAETATSSARHAAAEYLDSPSATARRVVERLPASVLLALMPDTTFRQALRSRTGNE